MKVLFYRDCRASCQIQLAKCGVGVEPIVSAPYQLETVWDAESFVTPVADLDGDGGW
jgi:20S proteasome subunit beta 7